MKWELTARISGISEDIYDELISDLEDVCKMHDAKFHPGLGEEDFDAEDDES